MRGRVALVSAIAVAVVLGALVAVLATSEPSTTRLAESPLLGRLAPPLAGDDVLAREAFDLVDDAGSWVLVNFFATWCVPCVEEHDDLLAFSSAHAVGGDATVVSIVFSDKTDDVREFFERNGGDWPVLADEDGRIATDWGVTGVPESYLVAPNGEVRAKIVGGIELDRLERLLAEAKGA